MSSQLLKSSLLYLPLCPVVNGYWKESLFDAKWPGDAMTG